MKTKSLILSLGMIVALFCGLVSCTKTEEVEAPSLSLDKKELQFAKEAGEMTVAVTTNQETWVATSPADGKWLALEMSGNRLTVKAKANTLAEARTSYVMVNAGGATPQVIRVTQVAADINLKLLPEVVEIPQQGGAFTVDVQSNDPEWKVELEEAMDWIEVRSNLVANFISLVVKANETESPREAKLLARSSNLKKTVEVVVKQAGLKAFGEYTLPLLQKNIPGVVGLISFEESIGNKFNRLYPSNPYSGPDDVYTFFPRKHFAERAYSVSSSNNVIVKVEDVSFDDQIIKSPYIDFLVNSGFNKVTSTATVWEGINEEIEFTVNVTAVPKKGTVVTFERLVKQPQDYPTWEKLPEADFYKYLDAEKYEKIRADEEAAGSTDFDTELVKTGKYKGNIRFLMCTLPESKRPHLHNAYFFAWRDDTPEAKLGLLEEKVIIYTNLELAFWTDKDTGKRYLTKEIKALLAKEGFTLKEAKSNGSYYYEKGEKVLLFRVLSFSDVNDGNPVLVLNAYLQDLEGDSRIDLRINNRGKYEEMLRNEARRADEIFKFLK